MRTRLGPGLLKTYEKQFSNEDEARKHIKVYENDYNELLDDPNVEAVIIATPLFMHHPMAVAAMRKGKHVLSEKLMGHDVAQCKEMARVCDASKDTKGNPLVMSVGHQRHYSILYDNAVEQIRQGLIGDIHHIRAQWHRDNSPGHDSWSPPLPGDEKLNKELAAWQKLMAGPDKPNSPAAIEEWQAKIAQKQAQMNDATEEIAAKYGYESKTINGYQRPALEELIRWRLWNRTAGGLMAELGSHQLDASSIFISAMNPKRGQHVHPLSVTALGSRSIFPNDRECDDHVYCMFEFPGKGYYKDDGHTINDPSQEGDGHVLLNQRQRLRRLRRDRVRHRGHVDPRARAGCDALQGFFDFDADRSEREEGQAGDGYVRNRRRRRGRESSRGRPGQPRLQGRNRTLGLVHSQPGAGTSAALHAGRRAGRCGHRTNHQPGHREANANRVRTEWFDPTRSETSDDSEPREAAQVQIT